MDTKTRILAKATGMFLQQGIKSITMDEISEQVGISKRTLYENFSNKEDLLREVIAFEYAKGLAMRNSIEQDHKKDPLEIIYQHFRYALLRLGEIHPAFISDLQRYHNGLWLEHVKDKQQENIDYTRQLIERGVVKGIFREQADAEILSRLIHAAMPLMISKSVFPDTRYTSSEVFRQVFMNFIRGMANLEGIKLIDEKFG
jgi:TetR/AcrR family transcriptional regulator, cholesterol catabolism regulator